jgi:arylsulfatase A
LYEGGIRTPMLVRWPGKVKAGSENDHISAFWDILPTFAEITGAQNPANIDGISFLPALLGKKQKQHEYLYWEFHEQGGKIAVRMGNWKMVKHNVDIPANSTIELYELATDIGETNNIATANPEIVRTMEEIIKQAHKPSEVFPFTYETIVK